ncbi:hypothetical protein KPZU09_44520 [Klebsiella pneumoniae]|uniref:Epi-inositol hydrolase n=1 Tax=Klebsiella pneumoniae TaxID=573 RepID=A0A919LPR1_KLEPN|nr:hypothetical protein KPZU09_44520 [Klebsiella pneumoniae]
MGKLRLTTAQALVKFLDNQYLEVDGVELKFVKGIFAIFGHGNVLGLGQALEQDSGDMRVYQGRNEQGWPTRPPVLPAALRRQIIACTSSIGPGGQHDHRRRHRQRQPHSAAAAAGRCLRHPPAGSGAPAD